MLPKMRCAQKDEKSSTLLSKLSATDEDSTMGQP
jgi:hypothetical protein